MDWRDLVAWHNIKTSTVIGNGFAGPLLLCGQDSSRIVLVISRPGALGGYINPATPPVGDASGILLGFGNTTIRPLNTETIVGNQDLATGDISLTATLPFLSVHFPQYGPMFVVWTADEHGALAQVPWYAWDGGGTPSPWIVWEVIQDRNPCDYVPGTTKPRNGGGRKAKGSCDPRQSISQLVSTWNGATAFGRGRNLFNGSVGLQRPQDKPAVQPDQYESGLG